MIKVTYIFVFVIFTKSPFLLFCTVIIMIGCDNLYSRPWPCLEKNKLLWILKYQWQTNDIVIGTFSIPSSNLIWILCLCMKIWNTSGKHLLVIFRPQMVTNTDYQFSRNDDLMHAQNILHQVCNKSIWNRASWDFYSSGSETMSQFGILQNVK